MEPNGDFIVKEKMVLLNTGRVHFELIRKKDKSTKLLLPAQQDYQTERMPSPRFLESPSGQVQESKKKELRFDIINDKQKVTTQTQPV